jgi:putative DNA primase/helicase
MTDDQYSQLSDEERQRVEEDYFAYVEANIGAPEPKPPREKQIILYEAGKLAEIVQTAEQYLMWDNVEFYDRGGNLVRPIINESMAFGGRLLKTASLQPVDTPYLQKRLSDSIIWQKNARKKIHGANVIVQVPTDPPVTIAPIIKSDAGDWPFNKIAGVITAPTIRRDGSILFREGYDKKTKLLLVAPPEMPRLIENPTHDDAIAASRRIAKLFAGFPFVDKASLAVAMSAFITPIVRAAITVAPLHAISAPTPGSGKSYLVDICIAAIKGNTAPATPIGKTEDETEKRISGCMLQGDPIIVLDNVNGKLEGDALCQCIERPLVKFRTLGESRMTEIENKVTIFATGNGIELPDDMRRRSILCTLDARMPRPELRQFKFDPVEEVLENRGNYIADVLTIVRAYKIAGNPDRLPRLASFHEWSDMVRSAIVWCGFEDPIKSMEQVIANDTRNEALVDFVEVWKEEMPLPITSNDMIEEAISKVKIQTVMKSFINSRDGKFDAHTIGKKIRSAANRTIATSFGPLQIKFRKNSHTRLNEWYLEPVEEVKIPETEELLEF